MKYGMRLKLITFW